MSKILQKFEERHKEAKMYRESPVNKAHGVNRMKEDGDGHPLHYVYPDGEMLSAGGGWQGTKLMDSVKEDVVAVVDTVSHQRDTSRISNFEKTAAGGRFLQNQIELQRRNTFVFTRNYREDNLKDHVDPTVHKPRHGFEHSLDSARDLLSIPGEFAVQLGNTGKLQDETVGNLITSTGPVFLRLNSREGMLNSQLDIVKVASAAAMRNVVDKINRWEWIQDATRWIDSIGARLGTTEANERPEVEVKYLKQIYEANLGVWSANKVQKYGHVYMDPAVSISAQTYQESFGDRVDSGVGFGEYVHLRNHGLINFSASRFFDQLGTKIENFVGNLLGGAVRGIFAAVKIDLSNHHVNRIKEWGQNKVSGLAGISLIRSLRNFTVDIDDIIEKVNEVGGALDPDFNLIPTNLYERYKWSMGQEGGARKQVAATVAAGLGILKTPANAQGGGKRTSYRPGASLRARTYAEQVQKYKGEQKTISIGLDPYDNTARIRGHKSQDAFLGPSADNIPQDDRGEHLPSWNEDLHSRRNKRYYKDWQQVDRAMSNAGRGTLFRHKPSKLDSDSIDVIMSVQGTEFQEVRFRAFIEDINETVTPSYNENKYIGRYETFYTYDRVTRDVAFKLTLHAFSKEERKQVMQKMAYLTSLAYPEASDNYLTPTITNLTIGTVYMKQPCIVQNLTHSIEGDTSWDIDEQTPMTISVSLGVRLLDKRLYTYQGVKELVDSDRSPFGLYLHSVDGGGEEPLWKTQGRAADAKMDTLLANLNWRSGG